LKEFPGFSINSQPFSAIPALYKVFLAVTSNYELPAFTRIIEACKTIMKHDGMECNMWPVVSGLIEAHIMIMKHVACDRWVDESGSSNYGLVF
jgi:hypothetical protein